MNILVYIDDENYDIRKLDKYFTHNENVSIFLTNHPSKTDPKGTYPIFTYGDLGIDAQIGIFKNLMSKSYQLTYQILDYFIAHLDPEENRKNLIQSIPSKLHRVISEALRAEIVIEKLVNHFKPDKIFTIHRGKRAFSWRIGSNDNFEISVLKDYCLINKIEHRVLPFSPLNLRHYFIDRTKEIIKILKGSTLDRLNGKFSKNVLLSEDLSENTENKPVIVVYLFGYMFFRNQIIWEYFNQDNEHYYLFITDHLNETQKHLLEKLSNLNFIHFKGLLPVQKAIPPDKKDITEKILNAALDQEIRYSRTLVINYLTEYIFGVFDNYLINHDHFISILQKYKIKECIFPSYWEIQPSLLISYCKDKRIPTLALQAGINPKNAREISLTDRYAIYGKWDYENFIKSGMNKDQLFILGWPLGEHYKSVQIVKNNSSESEINILYLLSMAGSWQYFIHFPEDSIILDLIDVARQQNNVHFTIRTHTGNNNKKFKKLIYNNDSNIILSSKGTLFEALNNADYVFTQATTAGFEAMVLDVPTFCLNLHSDGEATPFSGLNSKYIANSKDDLISIIQKLQADSEDYMFEYQDSKEKLLASVFNPTFHYDSLILKKAFTGATV